METLQAAVNKSTQWHNWDPFGFRHSSTMAYALSTMPPSPIKTIPALVRLLENPTSPGAAALTGVTTTLEHDCIHIVLGRGLLQQDESFVIGYSLGNSSRSSSAVDHIVFRELAQTVYPKAFKLSARDMLAFDHGFDCGTRAQGRDIHLFDFEGHLRQSIESIRRQLGIDEEQLMGWFHEEVALIPGSKASGRLRSHLDH